MENLTKQKIFVFIILIGLTVYYFLHWTGCHLADPFFFSKLNLTLQIIFDIRSDQHIPLSLARVLHNKVTQGSSDVINAYFAFWDIRFLLLLLSPFAVWGFFVRLYLLIKEKLAWENRDALVFSLALFIPCILLLHIIKNDLLAFLLFSLPIFYLSCRGWLLFLKTSKHAMWYVIALLLLSVWFSLLFNTNLTSFCV